MNRNQTCLNCGQPTAHVYCDECRNAPALPGDGSPKVLGELTVDVDRENGKIKTAVFVAAKRPHSEN